MSGYADYAREMRAEEHPDHDGPDGLGPAVGFYSEPCPLCVADAERVSDPEPVYRAGDTVRLTDEYAGERNAERIGEMLILSLEERDGRVLAACRTKDADVRIVEVGFLTKGAEQ